MDATSPTERVRRARAAQQAWARKPVDSRCAALTALRYQAAAQRDRIVETICQETGKPAADALAGDVMVVLEQMRFYESHAARILKTRKIGKPWLFYRGARFEERFEPHGVALIYAPANYPFQLAMVPMVTALFAGNAAILKCSEKTPGVARLIQTLCQDANLPEDLVQVIHDLPPAAGDYIDADPDLIFFTGSTENGRSVAMRAAEHLIPTVLELGGKDAALVFADCNLKRAVEGVTYGAFSNGGQVCVGTKRLYVENVIYEEFLEQLTSRVKELRFGGSSDSDASGLQDRAARMRLRAQIEDALRSGATLHSPQESALNGDGPAILSEVPLDSALLLEETFGPVLCVAPFKDEEDAIALANSGPFALSASVWTSDLARGRRVASALCAGSCAVNDVIRNIGNPQASFGGNRMSGYGRYHGPQGLYTFSRIKSTMEVSGSTPREINWFPFTRTTFTRLNALLGMRHNPGEWLSAFRKLFVLLFCVLSAFAAVGQPTKAGRLFIQVTLPEGSHGRVAYLIFDKPNGFPNQKALAVRSHFEPATAPTTTIDAGALPPGQYAVTVYQDVNGNGKLDAGFLGIPKEPVGVSNNPKPRFGPPRFSDCVFQMGNSDTTISITLVHPK